MSNSLNGMDVTSLFGPEEIICGTQAVERDELFTDLLKLLAERGKISDVGAAFNALVAREAQTPTIVAPGIAMPHARIEGVNTIVICAATSCAGIKFSDEEGGVARLIILILVPKQAPSMFLQATSALAKMLQDPDAASRAAKLKSPEEIWHFFNRGAHQLPDYVCAGDIMTRDVITIQETDTLERAIDMFARHNLTSLPVVDKAGEVVGMASADELLRVCLPDHILWMEDLSSIINFEPFAEMLRKEDKTCLSDIMSLDYITVQEDDPAIKVARELRRNAARKVFVLRGKKLVGIISLQDFINTVLRI